MNDDNRGSDPSTRRVSGLLSGRPANVVLPKKPKLQILAEDGSPLPHLDFGEVLVGRASASLRVRFRNPGNALLVVVEIGELAAQGFAMEPPALDLAPSASAFVTLTLTPTAEGAIAAALQPSSNAVGAAAGPELRAQAVRYQRPPRVTGQVALPPGSNWKKHPETDILRWGALVDGLRWYWDDTDKVLFYFIELDPPSAQAAALEALEGRDKRRSLEDWLSEAPFERWAADAPIREDSDEDLGPLTKAGVPLMRIGYGTNEVDGVHVTAALGRGYRLFDTAYAYKRHRDDGKNLAEVGAALADAPVPQEDLFIVYKVKPEELSASFGGDMATAVDSALGSLQRGWIDCLMLHDMPLAGPAALCATMAGLIGDKVRYIGLSNASKADLEACSAYGLRMVENKFHPHRQDPSVLQYCLENKITYIGYSILGSGSSIGECGAVISDEAPYAVLSDGALADLAAEEQRANQAELAITWAVRLGTVQIPTSRNSGRMLSNFRCRYYPLKEATLEAIKEMDEVITTAEQENCLLADTARSRLEQMVMSRGYWRAIASLYAFDGLAPYLDAIGDDPGLQSDPLQSAAKRLLEYVVLLQAGKLSDLGLEPGSFAIIKGACERGGGGPPMLLEWWTKANGPGRAGCREARTSAFGEVGLAQAPWQTMTVGDTDMAVPKNEINKIYDFDYTSYTFAELGLGSSYVILVGDDDATHAVTVRAINPGVGIRVDVIPMPT